MYALHRLHLSGPSGPGSTIKGGASFSGRDAKALIDNAIGT